MYTYDVYVCAASNPDQESVTLALLVPVTTTLSEATHSPRASAHTGLRPRVAAARASASITGISGGERALQASLPAGELPCYRYKTQQQEKCKMTRPAHRGMEVIP